MNPNVIIDQHPDKIGSAEIADLQCKTFELVERLFPAKKFGVGGQKEEDNCRPLWDPSQ